MTNPWYDENKTPIHDKIAANRNAGQHVAATGTTAAKAIVGGAVATAVAFLGALGVALTDGTVTGLEWTVIGAATLTAFGGAFGLVYATPNQDKV